MVIMTITNKTIIELYKAEHGLPVDYPLYTWAVWHNMGYRVRKGEKCKHRVQMWKMGTKKDEDGKMVNTGRCFHKTMSLFTGEQVERIK